MNEKFTELFDGHGNLIGCLLTAEAWSEIKPIIADQMPESSPEPVTSEPLADWATLKEFWDFAYPVDTDVLCDVCGNATEDWSADDPRLFRLTAANLSGLVTFHCQKCQARVIKRHFKDEITTETQPFQPNKQSSKEGRY